MRLASFNLLHGLSPADGRVDPKRLTDAVARLGAEVVALQEVDRDQPRSGRVDQTALVATALGADHARFAAALAGTPGEHWRPVGPWTDPDDPRVPAGPTYGVALVSRRAVRSWRRIVLPGPPLRYPVPTGSGWRWVPDEPRVGLAAVLDPPSPVGTVVSTHLSVLPGVNVAQLRRLVRAVADLPGPVVLLGDLNLPGPVPPRVVPPDWHSLGGPPTFPAPDPRVRLDHALVRGVLDARATGSVHTAVSDHRALVVDLE